MATIRDVARLAGVGVGTVSRVLSGKGSVSAATEARIKKAMQSLNYRPSSIARSLSSSKLDIIGVWTTHNSGLLTSDGLQIVEREVARHHRHCIITNGDENTLEDDKVARESIEKLVRRDCDGILIWGPGLPDKDVVQLEKSFPNLVVFNHYIPLLPDKCFVYDHYRAGCAVAEHLVQLGHRDIAIIGPAMNTEDGPARLQGFIATLAQSGIEVSPQNHVKGNYTLAGGQAGAEQLLREGGSFSAVFCGNDLTAVAAIATFRKNGLRIPEDLSVIGYDDHEIAPYTSPALTTVRVPFQDMALAAIRRLLTLCYDLDLESQTDFPVKLIERESSCACPVNPAI